MRTADHVGNVLLSASPLQDSGPSLHPKLLALGSPWLTKGLPYKAIPFCLTKLEVCKYVPPPEESQTLATEHQSCSWVTIILNVFSY